MLYARSLPHSFLIPSIWPLERAQELFSSSSFQFRAFWATTRGFPSSKCVFGFAPGRCANIRARFRLIPLICFSCSSVQKTNLARKLHTFVRVTNRISHFGAHQPYMPPDPSPTVYPPFLTNRICPRVSPTVYAPRPLTNRICPQTPHQPYKDFSPTVYKMSRFSSSPPNVTVQPDQL
jgi:hypothetical protein